MECVFLFFCIFNASFKYTFILYGYVLNIFSFVFIRLRIGASVSMYDVGLYFYQPTYSISLLKNKRYYTPFFQEKKIGSFYESTSNCTIQILISIYKITDITSVFIALMCLLLKLLDNCIEK